MKALISVALLCSFFVYVQAACLNFTAYPVTFHSRNFECIWRWDEEKRLPAGTRFSVQYKEYGVKPWTDKCECQNITERFCNLTREMMNETKNFNYVEYVIRVKAVSKDCAYDWVQSRRINVKENTTIGPPSLTYVSGVYSIKFTLRPPTIFIQRENGHPQTIENLFKDIPIEYHLSIANRKTKQALSIVQTSQEFDISGLDPDTSYNGTVHMFLETGKNSEIATFLVKTLPGNTWILLVVGLLVSMLLLAVVSIWLGYKYVKRPQPLPKSLDLRALSHFQSMNTTKDQSIISYIHGFSKPGKLVSPLSTSNVKLSLFEGLMQSPLMACQGNGYKSQCTNSIQTSIQSSDQTNTSPVSYLSQDTRESLLGSTSKNSSITYGVCVEDIGAVWKNAQRTNHGIQSFGPWDKNIQYRPQTDSATEYSPQNKTDLTENLLRIVYTPQNGGEDSGFRFGNEQLIQQLLLQDQKNFCEPQTSSILPLQTEEHVRLSWPGLGTYRLQATTPLSLLSSVKVIDTLQPDREADGGHFLLQSTSRCDLPAGDPVMAHASLSELETMPFQYRSNDMRP
ncbi:interleukin-22 receptor subunit alpha-1 [Ambystoma mexicanum]|uniref:interleukin-22 receptor subunit alpha-1 n=1 Tax=Ambystoma mexicanum TaxID=8296 RepID=UPI0037E70A79